MKKLFTLIAIILVFQVKGQENTDKNLHLFKFNPLQLVTSSLSFGYESFNKDMSRSTVVNLGIRYNNGNNNNYYGVNYDNITGQSIEQFSDWRGVTASIERRFYIPHMQQGKGDFLMSDRGKYGVYLSPSLRFDYNNNKYDASYFDYKYPQDGGNPETFRVTNTGNVNYVGIMPAMNFGIQFTLFQYAYIDMYVGGGIRLQNTKVVSGNAPGTNYNYNNSGPIQSLVIKEGVQPTGGISIGLPLSTK